MFPIPSSTRGLIFDCDGTLADTMPLHLRCWQRAMRELGGDLTADEFWAFAGVPTRTIIERLNQRHGFAIDPVRGGALKEHYYVELVHQVRPIAEVVQVVETYRGRLPMAVATGGEREIVSRTLRTISLLDAFDTIVSADDVERGKPAPDIFLEAARRLKVEPEDCVVFEDADAGVTAALAAGMTAIDVREFGLSGRGPA
jgi:beta-phosphoglucomutase family hydrolase